MIATYIAVAVVLIWLIGLQVRSAKVNTRIPKLESDVWKLERMERRWVENERSMDAIDRKTSDMRDRWLLELSHVGQETVRRYAVLAELTARIGTLERLVRRLEGSNEDRTVS